MGFMDSIKDALGGERGEEKPPPAPLSLVEPRHVDRDAPAEDPEDARHATGGKHRA